MTDDAEPAVEPTTTPEPESRWGRLNRPNRIAAMVLGAVASVFVAALIFGAGVFVGSEHGDSEREHHRGSESSQHDGDDQSDGGDEGTDGRDRRDDGERSDEGRGSDGGGGQDESDQQRPTDAPRTPSSAPPRP